MACTRVAPATAGGDDLHFLRGLPAEGAGGRVYGAVWIDRPDASIKMLGSAKVVLHSRQHDRSVSVVTDDKGAFEAANLPAGEYRIETVPPAGYVAAVPSSTVAVVDRGCTRINLEARPDGLIAGRLLDSRGRGVSGAVRIHRDGDDEPARFITGSAAADGSFALRTVPPGNYHLFVDVRSPEGRTQRFFSSRGRQQELVDDDPRPPAANTWMDRTFSCRWSSRPARSKAPFSGPTEACRTRAVVDATLSGGRGFRRGGRARGSHGRPRALPAAGDGRREILADRARGEAARGAEAVALRSAPGSSGRRGRSQDGPVAAGRRW